MSSKDKVQSPLKFPAKPSKSSSTEVTESPLPKRPKKEVGPGDGGVIAVPLWECVRVARSRVAVRRCDVCNTNSKDWP